MPRNKAGTDILFVTHRHEVVGGAEKALLEMVSYLATIGLRVHVIVGSEGSFTEELATLGIPYTIIWQPFWAYSSHDRTNFFHPGSNPTVDPTLQTVELINKLRPRLCVTNTIVTPWLAYAAAITGVDHAWIIHELGTAGLDLRYAIGEKQTLRTIDLLSGAIFYNSKTTAQYYDPWIKDNKQVRLIYPGGDNPQPTHIKSPFREAAFKLAAVGQIKPQKGQMDAIKAIRILRDTGQDVQLLIIGHADDPKYTQEIKKYIQKHNLVSHVLLGGYKKNPASYAALADAALVCSTNDSFGRVTVEAMLLGKPVIGARSGGTIEIINNRTTGLFYEPGNPVSLADKINTLLGDPSLVKKMGAKGKKDALKKYSRENRYVEFLSYFKSLPKEKDSLDLSPLISVFRNFRLSIDLLHARESDLEAVKNSSSWKLLQRIRPRVH